MANKKKPGFGKAIIALAMIVPTVFSLINKITALLGLEARLAGRSLISLIIFAIMSGILIASTWLCLLAMLVFYLLSLQWSIQLALLAIVALNLILLFIISLLVIRAKNNLTFTATRRQLRLAMTKQEEDDE